MILELKPTESLSIIRLISSLFEHWKGLFRGFWPVGGVWELNAGEPGVGGGKDKGWFCWWPSSDGPPKLMFPAIPVTGNGDVIVEGIGDVIELKSTRSPAEPFITWNFFENQSLYKHHKQINKQTWSWFPSYWRLEIVPTRIEIVTWVETNWWIWIRWSLTLEKYIGGYS